MVAYHEVRVPMSKYRRPPLCISAYLYALVPISEHCCLSRSMTAYLEVRVPMSKY